MSAHYAICRYDDATGSYIPLEVRPITDDLKKDDPLYQEGFQAGAARRDAEVAEFQRQAEENGKWWSKYNESKRALKEENQLLTKQRDDLLAGLKAARFHLDGQAHCDATLIIESIENYPHWSLGEDVGAEGEEA